MASPRVPAPASGGDRGWDGDGGGDWDGIGGDGDDWDGDARADDGEGRDGDGGDDWDGEEWAGVGDARADDGEGRGGEQMAACPTVPQLGAASVAALFTAAWCGVDSDIRERAAPEVVIVDVETWPHLADQYKVSVLPTLLHLEHGQEKTRNVGISALRRSRRP